MSHCWVSLGRNACHQLGSGLKGRPQIECSVTMVGVWEESQSKDTSWGVYNEQRGPDGVEKLPELHIHPRYPLFALHPQRRR